MRSFFPPLVATLLLCTGTSFAQVSVIGSNNARLCFMEAVSDRADTEACDKALEGEMLVGRDLAATYVNRAVVLTNATSGGRVHTALARWLVGEIGGTPWQDPLPLEPQPLLGRYVGDFWHSFGTTRVRATEDGDLEFDTRRHSTEDGSWQPPPEAPVRARLVALDCAIVTSPGATFGALIDFDPDSATPAWLRIGGRIAVRQ